MKFCPVCKKEIKRKWNYQQKKAQFCSHKCANLDLWKRTELTDEHKLKLLNGRKKFLYSPEVKSQMSVIKKEQYQNGLSPWNKGKQMTEEYRKRVSETLKGLTGINSRHWKGGLNPMWIRKQRLKKNGGSHTLDEWERLKAQYNWTCPRCNMQKKLTKDHIIPVSKGGSDNIENIQPLCQSCNSKKHNKC